MSKEANLIINKLINKYNYTVPDDYPRIGYDPKEFTWKKSLTKKI